MNADTREVRMVSGSFVGTMRGFDWMPDSRAVLFTGLQRTDTNLYRLDVATGEVQQVTQVEGTLSAGSFSRDRSRFVYAFEDFDTPPDLWVAEVGDAISSHGAEGGIRLTEANPTIPDSMALAQGEVVRWESRDGTEIEGILYLPNGYDRSEPLPFLLHIHGGPAGVFTNSFSASAHVWAGLGYAQLQPNVRGSSGYSDELLRGNIRDIGGGDYEDLMTGVDFVVGEGIADPDHLALRGWSYGGILGGWTITQTDRFKAASVGAMVSDWTSEYGPGFNYDVRLWYIGGTPWENPEDWRARSPLTHVANVTTPTIIFHGMEDTTDTEPQSMMFFQALKDQGKTVRYLRFPREPHGFREPHHQRIRDIQEIRWIQEHARGIEWEPWERTTGEGAEEDETGGQEGKEE
jgi:dipeptidyl aminopeptidase/acylaminoacyl peptidase